MISIPERSRIRPESESSLPIDASTSRFGCRPCIFIEYPVFGRRGGYYAFREQPRRLVPARSMIAVYAELKTGQNAWETHSLRRGLLRNNMNCLVRDFGPQPAEL